MKVVFRSNKLQKACGDLRLAVQMWGDQNARKVHQRIQELEAANTLADVFLLPAPRCHELKGERAGQFGVDVKHPFRLIFEPAHHPVPRKEDGGVDLVRVTEVRVLEMVDYHG